MTSIQDLIRTLAANGAGSASVDLALDLTLNEVVDEACQTTSACGAAISFLREGEMVCRASTGAISRGLGVRLETRSGLSGACMQTGTMQRCNDTETDPRPDAESCRLLGVRSILMLPLEDEKGRFGILEVFSPIANAFGDADVAILQSLARRAVQNKRAADEGTAMLENPQDGKHLLAEAELRELDLPGPEAPRDETGQRTTDLLTTILGVIVICAAVLLNLLIVRRAREVRIALRRPVVVASTQPEQNAPLTPAQNYGSQVKKSIPCNTAPAPTGGLVVREDGRVVFWQAPSQTTPRNAQDHK